MSLATRAIYGEREDTTQRSVPKPPLEPAPLEPSNLPQPRARPAQPRPAPTSPAHSTTTTMPPPLGARRPGLATLTAAYAALLLLSASVACARASALRHELHTGHSVDNRSPEIDPFWYVGRGVRPIGRFGKRQSASGGLGPLAGTLELLLGSLKGKELRGLTKTLVGGNADWLP